MNTYIILNPLFKDFSFLGIGKKLKVICAVCGYEIDPSKQDGWYITSFDLGKFADGRAELRKACCSMRCADMAGLQQVNVDINLCR